MAYLTIQNSTIRNENTETMVDQRTRDNQSINSITESYNQTPQQSIIRDPGFYYKIDQFITSQGQTNSTKKNPSPGKLIKRKIPILTEKQKQQRLKVPPMVKLDNCNMTTEESLDKMIAQKRSFKPNKRKLSPKQIRTKHATQMKTQASNLELRARQINSHMKIQTNTYNRVSPRDFSRLVLTRLSDFSAKTRNHEVASIQSKSWQNTVLSQI